MLYFVVRLSISECTIKDCSYMFDCSMGPWSDELLAPFQDGYRTERGKNAVLHYVVNLQASHKLYTTM